MVGDVREELAGSLVPGKNQILKESFNLLQNRLELPACRLTELHVGSAECADHVVPLEVTETFTEVIACVLTLRYSW